MRKKKVWLGVALLLVAIIGGVQLIATTVLANGGGELASLERDVTILVRQNQLLQSELAKKTALGEISEKSQALGFLKAGQIVYFDTSIPVAQLPQ